MNEKKEKISSGTIIRTVLLVMALVNQLLAATGHSPLPFDDEMVTELISLSFTAITSIVAWWKNNSFTHAAIAADEIMKEYKESE